MNNLLTAIITGVVAFIATNIDDILILLVFFAQVNENFRPWQFFLVKKMIVIKRKDRR
ncbi:hypothetical protein [Aphanizomenon sp. CS-733/32]|uniref:hypothetical protein n=1 Tax=Aphanizomenon sp. CS-733/32 TaxID=3021715 RepID=UPI003FA43347